MLVMRVYGKVERIRAGALVLAVRHHEEGSGAPVAVRVKTRGNLADWCDHSLDEGDFTFAVGYGYQRRSPDGPELWLDADVVIATPAIGFGLFDPISVSAHGVISEAPHMAIAQGGRRIEEEVVRFSVHVRSPRRDGPTVLRAKAWGGAAHWIAKRHNEGDRINIEGMLRELRWKDGENVQRRAHEVVIRRWHYAKPPEETR